MVYSIILVGVRHSGNLGAVARLCDNFNINQLILVEPNCEINDEAYERATHGRRYLDNAIVVNKLEEAKSYASVFVAFSARLGGYNSLVRSSISALQVPQDLKLSDENIGLIFGREDFGLFNEEVSQCDFLVHLPLPSDNPVLNLSHSVGIALWELSRETLPDLSIDRENELLHQLMTSEHKTAFFNFLNEILKHSWIEEEHHKGIERAYRSLLGRALITERESAALIGGLRNILKSLEDGHPPWDKCGYNEKTRA